MYFRTYVIPFLLMAVGSCSAQPAESQLQKLNISLTEAELHPKADSVLSRAEIENHLKGKVKKEEPLVIHVFVPLCDNANQGIVPVPEKLGDGRNLLTNLYWGALYGIKTHFLRTAKWTVMLDERHERGSVLERVVFYKKFPSGAKVYLVADAYAGGKMRECLDEYFKSLSGRDSTDIKLKDTSIRAYGQSNLIVFNGHNGLMETQLDMYSSVADGFREAAAIACGTNYYFPGYIAPAHAFPLLNTNNLLAPEAYVLEAVINSWANLESAEQIRSAAGQAYNKYQDCGMKYANNLFHTGW